MRCGQGCWSMHQESPSGKNSNRPLFLMSNICQPCVICSLVFKNWHGFCRARICRFIFSETRNIPPPPPLRYGAGRVIVGGGDCLVPVWGPEHLQAVTIAPVGRVGGSPAGVMGRGSALCGQRFVCGGGWGRKSFVSDGAVWTGGMGPCAAPMATAPKAQPRHNSRSCSPLRPWRSR